MSGLDLQLGLYLVAAAVGGGVIGWLIRSTLSSRSLNQMGEDWRKRFNNAVRQRDKLVVENESLKTSVEAEQANTQKHMQAAARTRTEIESLREKTNTLTKDVFILSEERDELKDKVTRSQNLVNAAKQQVLEQQSEFTKAGEFYKGQLESSFDQRKVLERRNDDAKSENESLRNLLMATKAEHESVNNILETAQSRLENLDAIERRSIALEAENAELRQAATVASRETEALQRDLTEMEALKEQNSELAHCLKSMESSRKQYEEDARRYRTQYEQSEKESETMRFKLGDIEKNWVDMQRQDKDAKNGSSHQSAAPPHFGLEGPHGDPDDLTEIVGIGKVFEETLHSLGVYHYRQIAAFGPVEIARINSELKEFKGRIEHDDWIGQAKELQFKKYGETDN